MDHWARATETRRTKTNSRWSTFIASPSVLIFHKTRNLKDSRRSPASDRLTSRTTFRTGFEKCCHSPSRFCEPVGFAEYALEYFEMRWVVVEIVERDMQTDQCYSHDVAPQVRTNIPSSSCAKQDDSRQTLQEFKVKSKDPLGSLPRDPRFAFCYLLALISIQTPPAEHYRTRELGRAHNGLLRRVWPLRVLSMVCQVSAVHSSTRAYCQEYHRQVSRCG